MQGTCSFQIATLKAPNVLSRVEEPTYIRVESYSPFQADGTRGCVSQCGIAIYIKKYFLKAKEEYENSNISPYKNIPNFQKIPLKETKILQDITM
jgi:hypothetical protein